MIRLHPSKLLLPIVIANFCFIANLAQGTPKSWPDIKWLDIFGEGTAAVLALVWLIFLLSSRPAGRVTNLLALGLGAIFVAFFQDVMDEFFRLPETMVWDQWLESGSMLTGQILLTFGIYHWHKEQLCINEQQRKRERIFREHRLQDGVTHLGDANYLRKQLTSALAEHRAAQQPLSLLLLDLDKFGATNRRFGSVEGDRLLMEMTELLLLNLRRGDLLCRYAADRFAILLPNTGERMAQLLANELANVVKHFAFKTSQQGESVFHTASIGLALALAPNETPEQLLDRANHALLHAKELDGQHIYLAA